MAVVVQDVARAEASVIEGLVAPTGDETEVRIHMCNTGEIATARVLTPGGRVSTRARPGSTACPAARPRCRWSSRGWRARCAGRCCRAGGPWT